MSYDPRTHTTAKQSGPRRVIYPFLNGPIKDSTTKMYERDMLVLPASFAPFTGAASTHVESAEALQGSDAAAYIVSESPLSVSGGMGSFVRTYANIPAAQVIPSSRFFNRPLMDDVFTGGSYAVSFDGLKSWVFTSRKTISSIGTLTLGTIPKDYAAETIGTLPASTATFIDSFPTSVAITLSSSASSIQTSLASLTKLQNITVSSTNDSVMVSWENNTGYLKSIDTSASGVTMSGSIASKSVTFTAVRAAVTAADTAKPNLNPSVRTISATGHGGAVGDRVVFWTGDRIAAKSIVMTVPDADTFTVKADDVEGKDLVLNYCGFAPDAAACYVAGHLNCTTRRTQNFYLPGVSVGITTYADLPIVVVYTDPLAWLGRIVAASTWAAIEVSDVTQWAGNILMQETTEIQMADALDTVTP